MSGIIYAAFLTGLLAQANLGVGDVAQRTTFVIDQAGVIKAVHTGGEAIDASKAVAAVQQCQRPGSK